MIEYYYKILYIKIYKSIKNCLKNSIAYHNLCTPIKIKMYKFQLQ